MYVDYMKRFQQSVIENNLEKAYGWHTVFSRFNVA